MASYKSDMRTKRTMTPSPAPQADAGANADEKQLRAASDKAAHQAIIQIRYQPGGDPVSVPVAELATYSSHFRKAILLIEDTTSDSDRCRDVLHEMGYDGIQLITTLHQAEDYLDDVINNLTHAPDAIVLDLGLGYESGFGILRKCYSQAKLQQVPILVWCKSHETHMQSLSARLGAKDYLVKSADKAELRSTLQRLLATKETHFKQGA